MVFHTFGDSHAEWGWSKIPKVQTHPNHGTLCHSFGRDKLARVNIAKPEHNVKPGDTVLFLFGEIDCSCHVHKYITPDYTYQNVIDDLVERYFEAIDVNVKQIPSLTVYVCSLPPAVMQSTVQYEPDENGRLWLQHRFLGSDDERKTYVLYFNQKVSEFCKQYGYNYFDIHDAYKDEQGFLNRKLSCPSVHIKDPIYIEAFLKEHGISLD